MRKPMHGFTLVEILVALFIFSILSLVMANGLHRLLQVQGEVNQQAQGLRDLQLVMVHLSRDVSSAIDRPITLAHGQEAASFVGQPNGFKLTCVNAERQQRVEYLDDHHALVRLVWPSLDQAEDAHASKRVLLAELSDVHFEYLDQRGKYHQGWPLQSDATQTLPKAVRMTLVVPHWGRLVQTFLLVAENANQQVHHAD